MSSYVLKLAINKESEDKEANGGRLNDRKRCPPHHSGAYKGLINHIITPHRIMSPSLLRTVKFSSQTMLYLTLFSSFLFLYKTSNLGNGLGGIISAPCSVAMCDTETCKH